MPLHHSDELRGCPARLIDNLTVGKPDSREAIDGGIEIALKILVPCGNRVVKQTAVDFDYEPPAVLVVAIAHAHRCCRTTLSRGPGQPMRPLHAIEICVLQDRAGAIGNIDQYRPQPAATANPPAGVEDLEKAWRCGPPRLAGVGQHRNGIEVGRRSACNIKRGVLEPQSWRPDMPQRPLFEVRDMMDADAVRLGQHPPVTGDGDMDHRTVVGQGRLQAQCRRSGVKHCGPGSLQPGQRSSVVDIHAIVDPRPLVASEQPPDVVVLHSRI